eukprot:15457423-Alexandrium_andersonii.AAC.1
MHAHARGAALAAQVALDKGQSRGSGGLGVRTHVLRVPSLEQRSMIVDVLTRCVSRERSPE